MKYVAAGLTAVVAFLIAYLLLVSIEEPVLRLAGWSDLSRSVDMTWWRAGVGLAMAACVFRLVVERRNNAALKWRKALAARARA
ncbi:hypothetical protein [Microvirga makkahensis]|uniref:Uncharacterized protein n=1 Tax=Microvirga makkahensis TaxID=1128670 RepID=A0A7X3SPI3_9HYPH|nr:hypothetical protein [Microvirga makkahensis]MXQ12169.1 hypothetical protein [Microvirga makkahensis]